MLDFGVPNHRVADSVVVNDFATLTIMSNANLFDIHLNRADIHGTPFETQYEQHLEKVTTNDEIIEHDDDLPEDEEQFDDFCDWLIKPCATQIRRLAPKLHDGISLQHFAFPKSHCLRLVPEENSLIAIHIKGSSSKNSLPTEPVENLCLPSSIQRVYATQTLIFPDPSGNYDYTCDVPRRVYAAGQEKFFKPITTSKDFGREVLSLNRISEFDLPQRINVPKLFGIVISEDGLSAIGMLLNWMPFGSRTLWNEELRQLTNMHPRWEAQVNEIVEKLHAIDIVWGDVNPGNIVIDPELNVWVVDFGGGFIDGFVDKNLAGTKEGDLDGIKGIFRQWIQSDDI